MPRFQKRAAGRLGVLLSAWLLIAACTPTPPRLPGSVAAGVPTRLRVRVAGRVVTIPLEEYVLGAALSEVTPTGESARVATRVYEVQAIIARLDAAQTAASASEGLQPLSWEMLDAMLAAGLTVGSHTRTHARLAHESEERIRAELVGSRRALEQRLRVPARHFAYPGGDFNGAVVRAVAAAGYATAFTICRHRDPGHPRLTIPRVTLWEASCSGPFGGFSEALLRAHVAGLLPAAGGCRHEGVAPGAAPAVIGPASRRSAAGRPAQQREAASCAASPEY